MIPNAIERTNIIGNKLSGRPPPDVKHSKGGLYAPIKATTNTEANPAEIDAYSFNERLPLATRQGNARKQSQGANIRKSLIGW
jgi:hypothetical protein